MGMIVTGNSLVLRQFEWTFYCFYNIKQEYFIMWKGFDVPFYFR